MLVFKEKGIKYQEIKESWDRDFVPFVIYHIDFSHSEYVRVAFEC